MSDIYSQEQFEYWISYEEKIDQAIKRLDRLESKIDRLLKVQEIQMRK